MFDQIKQKLKTYFDKNKTRKHNIFFGQKFFMPKHKERDPILQVKEVLFIQCTYVLFVFLLVLGIYEMRIGLYLNTVFSFGLALSLIFLLFYFRSGGKFYFIGFFQIILIWSKVFVLLMETGGIHSPMLLWALLPIILAGIYLDDPLGMLMWLLIIIMSLFVIWYFTANNILIHENIYYKNYHWFYNITFGTVFVVIMLLHNNEKKIYQQNLSKQISTLEIQREELHSTIEELKIQNDKIKLLNERLEDKQKIIENQLVVLKAFSKARAEAVEAVKKQKSLLEKLLTDLQDSLKFAQILQNLFLPSSTQFSEYFSNSFIIYLQKQYVGGDFYYIDEPEKDKILVIVGDCTGHGPAGGIMSSITLIFLKEFINKKIFRPKELIDNLRHRIRGIFINLKYSHLLYGLEIAAVLIDKKEKIMYFAGAHMPIIMFREGNLLEISTGNNMIGDLFPLDELLELKINLQNNDRIFLFSDGFYSQLNPKYEKITKGRFKKVLWNSSFDDIKLQRVVLIQLLNDWKQDMEQTDDITILGFEITDDNEQKSSEYTADY